MSRRPSAVVAPLLAVSAVVALLLALCIVTAGPSTAAAPADGFVFTTSEVPDDELPSAAGSGTRLT